MIARLKTAASCLASAILAFAVLAGACLIESGNAPASLADCLWMALALAFASIRAILILAGVFAAARLILWLAALARRPGKH
jgi:hypothetical protein